MDQYDNMAVPELDAEILRLGTQRDLLREQAKAATAARDAKLAAESLRAKLANLTDAERAALLEAAKT